MPIFERQLVRSVEVQAQCPACDSTDVSLVSRANTEEGGVAGAYRCANGTIFTLIAQPMDKGFALTTYWNQMFKAPNDGV